MKPTLSLLFAIVFASMCGTGLAKEITPKKGTWLDLRSNGLLFGTIAATDESGKRASSKVTYFIRPIDREEKPERLASKNGLFTFLLPPGRYEIFDWSLTGSKTQASEDRYTFEVKRGHLTYIGRIVTDLQRTEGADGKEQLSNRPYVLDQRNFDATLFAEFYPALTELDVILNARNAFVWRQEG